MKTTQFLVLLIWLMSRGASAQDASPETFYDPSTLQQIEIEFPQENWRYYLDSLAYNGEDLLPGKVTINGRTFENVGVRYRTGRVFTPGEKRHSLFIKLDLNDPNQRYAGHGSVILSQALRDPSLVREVLGYEIARRYMPAPLANYAWVRVNGEPYGLFVNVEPVEAAFLERHFGSAGGALFQPNPEAGNYTMPGCKSRIFGSLQHDALPECYLNNFRALQNEDWQALIHLTDVLNNKPQDVTDVLDVDRTLWMLAFNNLLVNLRSYTGGESINYYLYQKPGGSFVPILGDLNLAFGSYKNTGEGSDLKLKDLINLDPLLHHDNTDKPLISHLLQNPWHKKVYLSHLRSILHDFFLNDRYLERAKELQTFIRDHFAQDPNQRYTLEDLDKSLDKTIGKRSKIPGIAELMDKRSRFLKRHPLLTVYPPEIATVEVKQRPQFSAQRVETFNITAQVDKFPKKVTLYYRLGGSGNWREAPMLDDGKHDDGAPDDGLFGAIIVPSDGEQSIEYFIVAENAALVNFSPPNYMWERYQTSLEALNK